MLALTDFMALIRAIMLIATVVLLIAVYNRLRFRGFLTLATGFTISILIVVTVALNIIKTSSVTYQALAMVIAVMYLASTVLIYNSTRKYQEETKEEITENNGRNYS